MARVKSEQMRNALLEAAASEITKRGYLTTTISHIAKTAGTVPSNLYSYYPSKMAIFLAIFDPWMKGKLNRLLDEIEATSVDVLDSLAQVVRAVLVDLAHDETGYAAAMAEALASSPPEDYRPDSLTWIQGRLGSCVDAILRNHPADHAQRQAFVETLLLVLDGVMLRNHVIRPPDVESLMPILLASFKIDAGA